MAPRRTSRIDPTVGVFLVIWLSLLAFGREKMLRDPGTMWHTVVGQRIWADGDVPRSDAFSFTQRDCPWRAQQWLGECVMALVHRLAGIDGLAATAAAIIAWIFAGLHRRWREAGLRGPPAAVLLLIALACSSHHFLPRPHLATLAGMAWTFALLTDVEAGRASPRRLLWLPPVFVAWTNVHGGALGGVATIVIVALGWLFWPAAWREPEPRTARGAAASVPPVVLAVAVALCLAAVLVNPYGPALPAAWLGLMGSPVLPRLIVEHAPLHLASVEGVMILVLATVYVALLAATWRRRPRVTPLIPLLWFVLALTRVRHAPIFAVTAAIAIAGLLPHAGWIAALRSAPALAVRSCVTGVVGRRRAATVAGACVATVLTIQGSGLRFPLVGAGWFRFDPTYWPVQATDALLRHRDLLAREPRVYNDMLFGGYLIYHAPQARVFIDDRCELYGDWFLEQYADLHRDPDRFEALARYEDVRVALTRSRSRIDRRLEKRPDWTLLHRDQAAALYVRPVPPG